MHLRYYHGLYRRHERKKSSVPKMKGLDEEDRMFLSNWKICREAVAKTGEAYRHAQFRTID